MSTKNEIKEFLRQNGRKGGLARAKNHSKKQLVEWAKMGGRPPKQKNIKLDN